MNDASRILAIKHAITPRWKLWLAIVIGFPVFYYVLMFFGLLLRFQSLPNYFQFHDWGGSTLEIIRSTPSVMDMFPIIAEEWIFEVGKMNYDFGNGISEWSLNIIPAKVLVVVALAICIATIVSLILQRRASCSTTKLRSVGALGGFGAALVSMTSVTLSWVVCCATPSWVVGLAILGLGVSTSLWLEQFGSWIEYVGFIFLAFAIFWLSGKQEIAQDNSREDKSVPEGLGVME